VQDNELFYLLLSKFFNLISIPAVINTSFSMHWEPIICTLENAIRSFKVGTVDILVIINNIIMNKNNYNRNQLAVY